MRLPRLKELRERRGLSQEALSDLADVSRDSISSYERDVREAQPGTAKKLADALEVDVKNLVDMEKATVEVRWEGPDGRFISEKLRFTGEEVDSHEYDTGMLTLYECPNGYRVLEEYDSSGGMVAELQPRRMNRSTGEAEYDLYTAEEVVQKHPQFGETVGTMRVRDLD